MISRILSAKPGSCNPNICTRKPIQPWLWERVQVYRYRCCIYRTLCISKTTLGTRNEGGHLRATEDSVMDPRILDATLPLLTTIYGNPHSRSHVFGREALRHVDAAREKIADYTGANVNEIYFTSGITESNNLAIKGFEFTQRKEKKVLLNSGIDSKGTQESCEYLKTKGFSISTIPLLDDGHVDIAKLEKNIKQGAFLVTFAALNGVSGTIQPIKEIAELCKNNNAVLHCDFSKAFGRVAFNFKNLGIDLASFSGKDVYGPQGIGALYIRSDLRSSLLPIVSGGGQERGMRSGTLSPFLVAGFGEACELATSEHHHDTMLLNQLSSYLAHKMAGRFRAPVLFENTSSKCPGIVSARIPQLELDKSDWLHYGGNFPRKEFKMYYPIYSNSFIQAWFCGANKTIIIFLGRFTTFGDVDSFINHLETKMYM